MTTGNHSSPFEGHGVKQVIPLRALIIMTVVSTLLKEDVEYVIFPSEMGSPWICFNVGNRQFGIWQASFKLYEADEHGAMGEDPIDLLDPEAIKKT
jgi:hypothetical protein